MDWGQNWDRVGMIVGGGLVALWKIRQYLLKEARAEEDELENGKRYAIVIKLKTLEKRIIYLEEWVNEHERINNRARRYHVDVDPQQE